MKASLKVASHGAALAAGVLLALLVAKTGSGHVEESNKGQSAERRASGNNVVDVRNREGRTGGFGKAAIYRLAWKELGKETLGHEERLAMQAKLLEKWAKTDLHGALQAYLGETWDERMLAVDGGDPLTNALRAAFLADPMASWNVLAGSDMAIARELLAGTWGDVVGEKDPAMVISVVREMPPLVQITRLRTIFSGDLTPEQREDLFAKLGKIGDGRQFETWIKAIGEDESVDPAASFGKWSSMESGPEKTREMSAWATSLRRINPDAFATEWAKVPEEDRGQAARMLLSRVDNGSPALLAAIDCAIEAGQWDALKDNVADKLRGYPESSTPAILEWALKLPEREETRAIYNIAISNLVQSNGGPDPFADVDVLAFDGRKWLESLPAGSWHREAGFVELILGSMWSMDNLAAAKEAARNITDPRMAEEAAKVMYDWQLLMRRPKISR